MTTRIRKHSVIDSWSTIVENGAGQDKRIMEDMIKLINEAKIPNVTLYRDDCVSSIWGSPTRDYLILQHNYFGAYRMFLGARDYGSSLDASWFLTFVPPGFRRRIFEAYPIVKTKKSEN